MSAKPDALLAAYRAFGLNGDEDFSEVRARFRALVKTVHPDVTPSTPQTIAKLQRLLKAYEVLRIHAPRRHDLVITPEDARKGGIRTIKIEEREALVRVPVAVKSGTVLIPIGDPHWRVHVHVRDVMVETELSVSDTERQAREARARAFAETAARKETEETAGVLRSFYEKFVKASPAARLARWARKGAA
ncbi:J domain-containing protein [Alkalicaulis satelles]|uniref:J domain-containing protein n=1 Tax=Alkalicaulis satelles TaxID=2609175 RepID=A0A5M6ZI90_9PROT|nr:J domain-containing protein [Alkalicaulis satelles]KAA5804556.1 J domain-containing protein [Alkalicaulis satelles]